MASPRRSVRPLRWPPGAQAVHLHAVSKMESLSLTETHPPQGRATQRRAPTHPGALPGPPLQHHVPGRGAVAGVEPTLPPPGASRLWPSRPGEEPSSRSGRSSPCNAPTRQYPEAASLRRQVTGGRLTALRPAVLVRAVGTRGPCLAGLLCRPGVEPRSLAVAAAPHRVPTVFPPPRRSSFRRSWVPGLVLGVHLGLAPTTGCRHRQHNVSCVPASARRGF